MSRNEKNCKTAEGRKLKTFNMDEKYLTFQSTKPQSHITGSKNSDVVVCGIFDMSLRNTEFMSGKSSPTICLYQCFVQLLPR